jgi:hypothetical protein
MKPSWKVTGSRARRCSVTGVPCHSDVPRSPCSTMAEIQWKYCCHIGLSMPRAAMMSSRLFLSAATSFWLSIMSITSPGIRRTVTNTMMLARISVGSSASRRRMT